MRSRVVLVLGLVIGVLGAPLGCGKSKNSGGRDGSRGGASNAGGASVGGSVSGGRSGRGGTSGVNLGGVSVGGSSVGGEAGETVTGGTGGTSGGEGGSAGAGPHGCDFPCTARDCCRDIPGIICSNFAMAEVVVESAPPPTLPANSRLVGEAVEVTFCAKPREVTLRFDAGQSDPRYLLVVRVDGGRLTMQPVVVESDSVSVNLYESGTYAAIELLPPDNCDQRTLTYRVTANNNASLARFGGITHLEGDLEIGGAVTDLQALGCLTWISGFLSVSGTSSLLELEMDALVHVGRGITVSENASLTRASFGKLSFLGMDNYGWSLTVKESERLSAVELPSLVEVPGWIHLSLLGAAVAEPFELGLGRLETVGRSLEIFDANVLANLDGLENLKTIGGDLGMGSNLGLLQMDGLANLETVGGGINLVNNPSLQRADFPALRTLGQSYGMSLSCEDLPSLTNLEIPLVTELPGDIRFLDVGSTSAGPLVVDFENLETVDTSLVFQVTNLESLDGFGSLRRVGGLLELSVVPLTDLDALSNLEAIGEHLYLWRNPFLQSLQGLSTLESLGTTLTITENPMLPTCEAFWLRDRLQMNGFGGVVLIGGNLADMCE